MSSKDTMVEEHADGEPIPPLVQDSEEEEENVLPQWLQVLLKTRFWEPCSRGHKEENRAEDCMFCLQCYEVFCPHCKHDEPGHHLLKIRRYVYRSVVLVKDMHELNVDVSRIQTYITNGHKGVLLRPMRRSPHFRPQPGATPCETCTCWLRSTLDLFCSLTCKWKADVSQDDFSGPEAERRYKNLHTNTLQLPMASDNDIELAAEATPVVILPEPIEWPPMVIPPQLVEAPPVVISSEPVEAPPAPQPAKAQPVVIAPEPIEAPSVVIPPEPVEAPPMVIPPEPVEAPPVVIQPGLNNSKRRRPRKQVKPQRAPFF